MHVHHVLLIHLSVESHWGRSHFLWAVQKLVINTDVSLFGDTKSFLCIPSHGLTGSYENSVLRILSNIYTDLSQQLLQFTLAPTVNT